MKENQNYLLAHPVFFEEHLEYETSTLNIEARVFYFLFIVPTRLDYSYIAYSALTSVTGIISSVLFVALVNNFLKFCTYVERMRIIMAWFSFRLFNFLEEICDTYRYSQKSDSLKICVYSFLHRIFLRHCWINLRKRFLYKKYTQFWLSSVFIKKLSKL